MELTVESNLEIERTATQYALYPGKSTAQLTNAERATIWKRLEEANWGNSRSKTLECLRRVRFDAFCKSVSPKIRLVGAEGSSVRFDATVEDGNGEAVSFLFEPGGQRIGRIVFGDGKDHWNVVESECGPKKGQSR